MSSMQVSLLENHSIKFQDEHTSVVGSAVSSIVAPAASGSASLVEMYSSSLATKSALRPLISNPSAFNSSFSSYDGNTRVFAWRKI